MTTGEDSNRILFLSILALLVFGVLGTFLINANALSSLVAGIILLIAFVIMIIFRQVVMEITPAEVALSYGTERVWISRRDIAGIKPLELTPSRRFNAFISLGPWSAVGREKIKYFGAKAPMVIIRTSDGRNFAVSVESIEGIPKLT